MTNVTTVFDLPPAKDASCVDDSGRKRGSGETTGAAVAEEETDGISLLAEGSTGVGQLPAAMERVAECKF